MGQYYIPTFLRKREVNPQLIPEKGIHPHALFDGLKLFESGWAYSATMYLTEKHLRSFGNTGTHFAYAGDYEERNPNVLVTPNPDSTDNTFGQIHEQAYALTKKNFTKDKYERWKSDRVLKYFVNHDKKQYVHLNVTFTEDEISPLAILCYAGDKYDQYWHSMDRDDKLIGLWAYDRVAITDEIPQGYINVEPTNDNDKTK